jgi:hypothetical protein
MWKALCLKLIWLVTQFGRGVAASVSLLLSLVSAVLQHFGFIPVRIYERRLALLVYPTMTLPSPGLPTISHLPPIEIPDPPSAQSSLERDPSSLLRRSSTSLASRNSFITALSSTSGQEIPAEGPSRTSSPAQYPSLPPPQSLRKSISVDSFVRRDVPKSGIRPKRTNTDLATQMPVIQAAVPRNYEDRSLQRNRGVSFSTQGDYDLSTGDDINLGLWLSSRRRASWKGKDPHYPNPGDLKLPPRVPTLSSASSISLSTTHSSPREECQHIHTTTSMQSIPSRIANPVLANISGRARSGSLGVKIDSGGKPMLINTEILVGKYLLSRLRISIYCPSK